MKNSDNRIVEVDLFESRTPNIKIRTVAYHPVRGHVPHEEDIKADITVLTNGLLGLILHAEENEVEKGDAIKWVINELESGYVEAGNELSTFNPNEESKEGR